MAARLEDVVERGTGLARLRVRWHGPGMATTPTPDVRQQDGSSDRRWIILTPDGSSATLGRARDPSDEEIRQAEADMEGRGLSGWLAVQSHSLYVEPFPTFMSVRHIGVPTGSFEDAVAALRARHEAAA